jgi:hypothetical protein
MEYALRIDADPTLWELSQTLDQVPTSSRPAVLPVAHPVQGNLVLSPRSVGSVVRFENQIAWGTRPNGLLLLEQAIYVPSPAGLDLHSNPANFYTVNPPVDPETLQASVVAAMTDGTFCTVSVTGGEVVINGARIPFVVLCKPSEGGPGPSAQTTERA